MLLLGGCDDCTSRVWWIELSCLLETLKPMELVRVCWGKDEVHLKRSEVRTLEALKERLQVVEGFDTNGM